MAVKRKVDSIKAMNARKLLKKKLETAPGMIDVQSEAILNLMGMMAAENDQLRAVVEAQGEAIAELMKGV